MTLTARQREHADSQRTPPITPFSKHGVPPSRSTVPMTLMCSKPFFSVVTPSLNQGRYLHDAIASVASQAYDRFEHIVVDALSTDKTLDVLRAHEGTASLRWISEADRGQSDALNKGVRLARGEWILWLNADDLLLDGALDAFAEAIERHPRADVFYGHQRFIDDTGHTLKTVYHLPFRYRLVRFGRYLPPSTGSVFRRSRLVQDPLDDGFHYLMDKEWFLRCGNALRAVRVNHVVSAFRVTDESKTGASVKGFGESPRQVQESILLARTYGAGTTRRHSLTTAIRTAASRVEYYSLKGQFAAQYARNSIHLLRKRCASATPDRDDRLTVTYVGSFTGQGGAERCTVPVAQWQIDQGHRVSLQLLRPLASSALFDGFSGRLAVRRPGPLGGVRAVLSLAKSIARSDVVVGVSEFTPTFVAYLLAIMVRKPFCAEVHANLGEIEVSRLHSWLAHRLYPRFGHVRSVSDGVASNLVSRFGVSPSRVSMIPNPFDLQRTRTLGNAPVSAEHEELFAARTVVAVGRLTRQKRFDLAVDALASLRADHDIDAQLVIIGDGELKADLQAHATLRGVADQVHIIGFIENPFPYMRRADALLLSSDYEGFGRVIVEAMALGCPIVSTDCPSGPSDIIQDRVSGVLVPVGAAAAMAAALSELLTDHVFASRLAAAGLERTQAYSLERVTREYDSMLRTIVDAHSQRGQDATFRRSDEG